MKACETMSYWAAIRRPGMCSLKQRKLRKLPIDGVLGRKDWNHSVCRRVEVRAWRVKVLTQY